MNNKLIVLLLLFMGLFVAAVILQKGELLWLAFPVLMYMAVGLIRSPVQEAIQLRACRELRRIDAQDGPVIEVKLDIQNLGPDLPWMQIIDGDPEEKKAISGHMRQMTALAKNGELSLSYTIPETRGRFTWKNMHIHVGDPFGLMVFDQDIPAEAELTIPPARESFQRLPLRPRYTLHAPGLLPAHRAGAGTDFWGVRLYHAGDSLRWLYWRLNARHPGQFFTREFEQEEVADIGLILDARRETDLNAGDENLLEHTIRAAASLAEGFIHQGNRVSLLVWSQLINRIFPGYGKYQLIRILHTLSSVKSSTSGKFLSLNYVPMQMFSKRAILVVLSPLARADNLFFPRVRAAGYQAMLISPNPYDFIHHNSAGDAGNQRAYQLANQERRIQLEAISRLNIQVVDWSVREPIIPLVRKSFGHLRGQGETEAYYGA